MTNSGIGYMFEAGFDLHKVSREELDRRASAEAREYMHSPIHSIAPLVAIKTEQMRREQ